MLLWPWISPLLPLCCRTSLVFGDTAPVRRACRSSAPLPDRCMTTLLREGDRQLPVPYAST